jgi:hypothetical protein
MTVLANRQSCKSIAVSFWKSPEAMHSSEEAVRSSRDRAAEAGLSRAPQVERFEVIVDTMA